MTYELSPGETVSEGVITAVSELIGADPIPKRAIGTQSAGTENNSHLQPLYNVIDPEALDSLFETTSSETARQSAVEFTYEGCAVTIHDGRYIIVEQSDWEI